MDLLAQLATVERQKPLSGPLPPERIMNPPEHMRTWKRNGGIAASIAKANRRKPKGHIVVPKARRVRNLFVTAMFAARNNVYKKAYPEDRKWVRASLTPKMGEDGVWKLYSGTKKVYTTATDRPISSSVGSPNSFAILTQRCGKYMLTMCNRDPNKSKRYNYTVTLLELGYNHAYHPEKELKVIMSGNIVHICDHKGKTVIIATTKSLHTVAKEMSKMRHSWKNHVEHRFTK